MHIWKMLVVAVAAVAVLGVPQRGHAAPQAAPLCAFLDSTTISGTVGTASFHVVRDGCQVSLVSISKFANGSAIFDTATGVFAANETFHKTLVQRGIPHGYQIRPGGHNWDFWRTGLADHIRFHAGLPSGLTFE